MAREQQRSGIMTETRIRVNRPKEHRIRPTEGSNNNFLIIKFGAQYHWLRNTG
jgi:hypothetical protein